MTKFLAKEIIDSSIQELVKKWFHAKAECTNYSREKLNKIINGKKAFICENCGNEHQASEESVKSDTDEGSSENEEVLQLGDH